MDNSFDLNNGFIIVNGQQYDISYNHNISKDETLKCRKLSQEDGEKFIEEMEEESCIGDNDPNESNGFTSEPNESEANSIIDLDSNKKDKIENKSEDFEEKKKEKFMNNDELKSHFTNDETKVIADLSTNKENKTENNSENIEEKEKSTIIDRSISSFTNDKAKVNAYLNTPKIEKIEENNNSKDISLFTLGDKKDIAKKYSLKPLFKVCKIVNKKNKKTRKYDRDNMFKKVRQAIYSRLKKIFRYKLKKLLSTNFNQNSKKINNKKYLKMKLKELLKHIYIENIKKKTKNNKYILTKEDEKFLAYIEKDFNDEKLKPILNMKMEDIYKEFFKSQEYQDLIEKLRNEGNYYFYIYTFIEKNKGFVKYYKDAKERKKKNK